MNDPFGRQTIPLGDFRFSCFTAAQRPAFSQQFRPRSAVNGVVYAASAEKAFVGGINDALAVQGRNVTLIDFNDACLFCLLRLSRVSASHSW